MRQLTSIRSGIRRIVVAALVVACGALWSAPATAQMFGGVQEDIPDGANRIILEQEDVPPAEVYIDALEYFQRADYIVMASEETMDGEVLAGIFESEGRPLAFAVRKQVNEEMALKIMVNVEAVPGGGRLIASADWAERVTASAGEWHDAKWTEGPSRKAFFEALEALRGTAYDAMTFEIGAAVAVNR